MGSSSYDKLSVKVPWALDDPWDAQTAPKIWGGFNAVNRAYVKWLVDSAIGGVFIGPNPPPNPFIGQLWWRNDPDGDLYIYYDDNGTFLWVAATATPGSPSVTPFVPVTFPPNPTVGDIVLLNDTEYQWDGIVWTRVTTGVTGDALVPIGPDPGPANPQPGQLWWRNDPDGNLYIFYEDATSAQWVPASPGGGSTSPLVSIGPNPPANPQVGMLWWRNDPDGVLYVFYQDATSSQWVPASPSGSAPLPPISTGFAFTQQITLLGNDVSNATTPAYIVSVPQANLPTVPCNWCATGGNGSFFVSNFGLGATPVPGNINWYTFIEDGFMSNNWVIGDWATISRLNNANNMIVEMGGPNQIFSYDPATSGGIRFGFGMGGGTNGGGWGPLPIMFGMEARILPI